MKEEDKILEELFKKKYNSLEKESRSLKNKKAALKWVENEK